MADEIGGGVVVGGDDQARKVGRRRSRGIERRVLHRERALGVDGERVRIDAERAKVRAKVRAVLGLGLAHVDGEDTPKNPRIRRTDGL